MGENLEQMFLKPGQAWTVVIRCLYIYLYIYPKSLRQLLSRWGQVVTLAGSRTLKPLAVALKTACPHYCLELVIIASGMAGMPRGF